VSTSVGRSNVQQVRRVNDDDDRDDADEEVKDSATATSPLKMKTNLRYCVPAAI